MNTKPRLLDLFCGAGGCCTGYQQAGYEVWGVDLTHHSCYPGDYFIRGDALQLLKEIGDRFDVIHASPPCQKHSQISRVHHVQQRHKCVIRPLRKLLKETGRTYVIENVLGAPLYSPLLLCGSMFGLMVRRHRLFEIASATPIPQPPCRHDKQRYTIGVYGHTGGSSTRDALVCGSLKDWKKAMQIDWMNSQQLAQAIPPAYTFYIGSHLKGN